jgi:outer membrane biogenesis lipoprotein LolB
MSRSGALSAVLGLVLSACGAGAPVAPVTPPSAAQWREARSQLVDLRAQATGQPRTIRLSIEIREPVTGRVMQARGAVAIAPPRSLRMVLVGPGGTTALDLWSHDGAFRFAVPALDLLRRGDSTTPRSSMRGIPVDFLQWWLLRPFDGRLVNYRRLAGEEHYVLRDGAAVVELIVRDDGSVWARRSTFAIDPSTDASRRPPRRMDEETLSADRLGCGVVHYHQGSTGLRVKVTCEGVESQRAPSPRAFVDPDEAER